MAEPKPTPRKRATAKPPTKAAALKALGLSQADLDAIKAFKQSQDTTEVHTQNVTGLNTNPQNYLEDRPVPQPVQAVMPESKEQTWYMRNLRNVEVNFRLTRQQRQGERRTHLMPRGQRGDINKLLPEDLADSELRTQVAYSLVEIITEAEARSSIELQATNLQAAVHPAFAMMRNELGKEYAPGAIRVASDEEAYGIKVADLNPVVPGELGEVVVDRRGIQRELQAQPGNAVVAPIGGNPAIISDGYSNQLGATDQASMQRDALARSKNFEGPGAGLGQVSVVVNPVQRS